MRLYVEPMDAIVEEVSPDGRVRYGAERGRHLDPTQEAAWSAPSLQERRAIIYAATREIEALTELVEILEREE
jgi:hypothetical protein